MESREELEERVRRLEEEVAAFKARGGRAVRRRATWGVGNIPMWAVAVGPDPARGESRGHARAIFAFGDIATGVVAFGGWARGLVAVGGLATGLVSVGGLSIGLLAAVGGLAIGSLAFGGGAVGTVALGGGAVGKYACGAGAAGEHVVSVHRRDPEAEAFFREHGLLDACSPGRNLPAEDQAP